MKENTRGRIAINIDNVGSIFINNKFIRRYGGGWGGDTGRYYITLIKGLNNIRVEAENLGMGPNPAGIAVTIFDNHNRMLAVSNRNWTWTTRNRPCGPGTYTCGFKNKNKIPGYCYWSGGNKMVSTYRISRYDPVNYNNRINGKGYYTRRGGRDPGC